VRVTVTYNDNCIFIENPLAEPSLFPSEWLDSGGCLDLNAVTPQKPFGTGIGTKRSQELITQAGGRLRYEITQDTVTTMVTLDRTNTAIATTEETAPLSGLRILFYDHNDTRFGPLHDLYTADPDGFLPGCTVEFMYESMKKQETRLADIDWSRYDVLFVHPDASDFFSSYSYIAEKNPHLKIWVVSGAFSGDSFQEGSRYYRALVRLLGGHDHPLLDNTQYLGSSAPSVNTLRTLLA
ncbi:hypothetical protein COY95_04700, partial [Candidatus Woesearchaeota archaeon CG_4_10_14_0_8_um_filter_47_5]